MRFYQQLHTTLLISQLLAFPGAFSVVISKKNKNKKIKKYRKIGLPQGIQLLPYHTTQYKLA